MTKITNFLVGMAAGMIVATYSTKIKNKIKEIKESAMNKMSNWQDDFMEGEEMEYEDDYQFESPKMPKRKSTSTSSPKVKRKTLD